MRRADAVICNSRAAANEIPAGRVRSLHVVPNGIDCGKFSPSPEARNTWRARYGLGDSIQVVGIVARLDPMKDHPNFLRAAARASSVSADLRFVVAGAGSADYERKLLELAKELGIADRILWLGEVTETVDVYRGIDLLVSSSAYGEGFSNALGEGMACGVSAVATDVGDSKVVLGDHGRIVPPRAPEALAAAIIEMLEHDNASAREARRQHIAAEFGVAAMVAKTEKILCDIVQRDNVNFEEA
jgi:glycosyltransferase involved in cell wall biosynthesis